MCGASVTGNLVHKDDSTVPRPVKLHSRGVRARTRESDYSPGLQQAWELTPARTGTAGNT